MTDHDTLLEFFRLVKLKGSVVTAMGKDRGYIAHRHSLDAADQIAARAERAAQSGLHFFFVPAEVGESWNTGTSPRKEHIIGSRLVWADVDALDAPDGVDAATHYERERERTLAALTTERPADVPAPTAITFTGGGHQAIWSLDEMLTPDETEQVCRALARRIAGARVDSSVFNCNRLLRPAGSWNPKDGCGRVPRLAERVEMPQ